jgi:hypothetical protein
MLTFLTNIYCPKADHRPDHSILSLNIAENIIIIPKHNIFTETRTQDSFRVCDLSLCCFLVEKKYFYAVLLSCLISEIQKTSSLRLKPRTVFRGCGRCSCNILVETTNFCLDVFLSCLVSKIQKPPSSGSNPGHFFRRYDLSENKRQDFVSLPRPDRLWGLPSFKYHESRRLFNRE